MRDLVEGEGAGLVGTQHIHTRKHSAYLTELQPAEAGGVAHY